MGLQIGPNMSDWHDFCHFKNAKFSQPPHPHPCFPINRIQFNWGNLAVIDKIQSQNWSHIFRFFLNFSHFFNRLTQSLHSNNHLIFGKVEGLDVRKLSTSSCSILGNNFNTNPTFETLLKIPLLI